MRSILYFLTFSLITPLTIFTSLFTLNLTSNQRDWQTHSQKTTIKVLPSYNPQVLAPTSSEPAGILEGAVTPADARTEIIRQYLARYNSPLEPYAQLIVNISEKYGLDFRLLVAIAQQESNLCKKIPENSYNCWGWGIHSRGTLYFSSYPEAIETVARGLKEEYLDKGYTTPEEIMKKYTPLSPGTWAYGVQQFLDEME
jgi:hypothetical protein